MSAMIDTIRAFAEPLLADMGFELVELQYHREQRGWVLRFFIDSEEGISLDDCVAVSREISAYLEVEDLIEHAYHLEVSSPGAERPLKTEKDFVRFTGKKVRIKLREPVEAYGEQKVFEGLLQGLEKDCILLTVEGKEQDTIRLEKEKIAKARLSL